MERTTVPKIMIPRFLSLNERLNVIKSTTDHHPPSLSQRGTSFEQFADSFVPTQAELGIPVSHPWSTTEITFCRWHQQQEVEDVKVEGVGLGKVCQDFRQDTITISCAHKEAESVPGETSLSNECVRSWSHFFKVFENCFEQRVR